MDKGFEYSIKEKFGVIGTSNSGWTTELNMVQWGEYKPKYDIRAWSPDHAKMGKGVGLFKNELKALRDLLNTMNLD